jgi:hypothetical protein
MSLYYLGEENGGGESLAHTRWSGEIGYFKVVVYYNG